MNRVFVLALLTACWSVTAHAQVNQVVDLSGLWTPLPRNQDGSGLTGDAAGVPLSPNGQWRAQSWSPEDFDVAEWVCRPHSFDYSLEGPRSWLRFWPIVEPATQTLIAYEGHIEMMGQRSTIWMDGRPHPPENAAHTWSGFSTGQWDGDVLVVTTTHLKETYIRRSGLMRSDKATVRTRWRMIGDYLQATSILYDPVNFAEPYVRSTMMWRRDPAMLLPPYPCEEATETAVERGRTPHFLPGQSPLPGLDPKVTDEFGTPPEARLGGPATMYPEYIAKMKTMPVPNQRQRSGEGGN
jgi:hypothetical protein